MRMVEVQAVDGGSPRHRSCVGRGKQHHSDREGYEGERAQGPRRISHCRRRTHLDACHALCQKGSYKVDAPASVMCHHLLGKE